MGDSSKNKIHGSAAEMLVAHHLMRLSFGVAFPLTDSEPYDLIAINKAKIWRIQVKATDSLVCGAYRILFCHGSKKKKLYTRQDCDFLVGVVYYPSGAGLYVIPVEKMKVQKGIFWEVGQHPRYPAKWPRCKWEDYREGWNLLT